MAPVPRSQQIDNTEKTGLTLVMASLGQEDMTRDIESLPDQTNFSTNRNLSFYHDFQTNIVLEGSELS
jgi:hypothetical protein